MEAWLNKLGLQKSESGVKGRQIPELYKNKEYAKIERYIVDELHKCETLFDHLVQNHSLHSIDDSLLSLLVNS